MDIEEYAEIAPQYYKYDISPLLKKYLNSTTFLSLLDCGCGDGSLLYSLKKDGYFANRKIFAIDLSSKRIKLIKKIDKHIKAFVDDAERMRSIKTASVDFFVSTQVIEHVDDRAMVKNINRTVKKNGIVYVSTVFKKWYGWFFYRNNGKWVLDPTHLREYAKDEDLLKIFRFHKFKLLENKKTLQWFPLVHFFIKRLGFKNRYLYQNRLVSLLEQIKVPIFGYYNWEIVFKKN